MLGKGFLPVGLVLALLLGLAWPEGGRWLSGGTMTLGLIATIFLISGYQTHPGSLRVTSPMAGALGIVAVISFGGGAALGWVAAHLPGIDPAMATGLIVMSVMAPTLSSVIVITRESGGDALWATLLTMSLNLLGIFVIPLLLSLLLSGSGVGLPAGDLLVDLILSVLLPFCCGVALRWWWAWELPRWVGRVPTLLVIALSYVSFSVGREALLGSGAGTLLLLIVAVLGIHLALFGFTVALSRWWRFAVPEQKAMAFLASQKTLPTALGVLVALGDVGGAALLPCVLFHFSQILVDAVIAARWRGGSGEGGVELAGLPCLNEGHHESRPSLS